MAFIGEFAANAFAQAQAQSQTVAPAPVLREERNSSRARLETVQAVQGLQEDDPTEALQGREAERKAPPQRPYTPDAQPSDTPIEGIDRAATVDVNV